MEDSLYSIAGDLPTMFDDTLLRIQQQGPARYNLALQAMAWVLYARRPLTIKELRNALATRPGHKEFQSKYKPSKEMILGSCQGLVVLLDSFEAVSFVHYTVQEYLLSKSDLFAATVQQDLAHTCVTYLSFTEFLKGPCSTESSIVDRLQQFPFLGYAARFWGQHASSGALKKDTHDLVSSFLSSQSLLANMTQMKFYVRSYQPEYWSAEEANSRNPLMAAFGAQLEEIAKAYVDSGKYDVNARSVMGTTAIIQAASVLHGNASLVRELLRKGADPLLTNWYGNALHCAAEAGNCDTILELVKSGIDVNVMSPAGRTALSCTVDHDRHLAAGLLLDHGARLQFTSEGWASFLHEAVNYGAGRIVGMLLERRVCDVDEILLMKPLHLDG